ncbi:hypothetical protein BLA29_013702, partial [Euroglyphus maynei]
MQDLAITLGTNDYDDIINLNNDPMIATSTNDNNNLHHNSTNAISSAAAVTINETTVADQLMADASIYYGSTPHQKMSRYISIAWFFSTVIELVAIVWVKFWDHNRDDEQFGDNNNNHHDNDG